MLQYISIIERSRGKKKSRFNEILQPLGQIFVCIVIICLYTLEIDIQRKKEGNTYTITICYTHKYYKILCTIWKTICILFTWGHRSNHMSNSIQCNLNVVKTISIKVYRVFINVYFCMIKFKIFPWVKKGLDQWIQGQGIFLNS